MNKLQQFYEIRAKRLALNREADMLEQQEKDILYELTKDLNPAQAEHKYTDGDYSFKAKRKVFPRVDSWEQALNYIRAEAAVDLLQRRLTESAVILRWENGVTIPGVEKDIKWPVTVSKD